MPSLLILCLLLLQTEETDAARDQLMKAVEKLDRYNVDRACATLVKQNHERTPEIFVVAFRAGMVQLDAFEKERLRIFKELSANEPVKDKDGKIIKGNFDKWVSIRREYDALLAKMDILVGAVPRIAGQLSRLTSFKTIIPLLQAPEWYLRACAAEALGRIPGPESLAALVARAKTEENPGVRIALADAFAPRVTESEVAREILLRWMDAPMWQVKLAAVQAIAMTGDKTLVPAIIKTLQGASSRMRYEVNECLKKLTKADRHGDAGAWEAWWEKNQIQVVGGTYTPAPYEAADPEGHTTFYGIPVNSTRVVFIIDTSVSMKEPSTWKPEKVGGEEKLEGERAIDIARYEIRKIIRGLSDGAAFCVIGMYGRLAMLSEKMVISSKSSRENAIKFIQGLELRSGTDVHGALMRALDFSGGNWNTPPKDDSVDTVFILSDGVPSVGLLDRSQVADRILDAARFKRIAVNAIAIESPPPGREILKKICDGTGGRFVPR